ncbi:hypothetical protein G3O06_23530 [Burkholderia sp. Ac-20345]|uniref:hypothetical protein n=1 Tax=Burkholderia sp. Ac-20345 TaxID=2703891 RepID=UPI00197C66F8|nr:hypothetical protein [Burkholderia sp. Ac-20345]MBN3780489.1 hypothetical protein [Burkholderia sp. Ac-20345]
MKHPMQPIHVDSKGVVRFVSNDLVSRLVDVYPGGLDAIASTAGSVDDLEQLLQLIGYSVSGFGDQPYVRREVIEEADRAAGEIAKE